jgi:hypothetical protein
MSSSAHLIVGFAMSLLAPVERTGRRVGHKIFRLMRAQPLQVAI